MEGHWKRALDYKDRLGIPLKIRGIFKQGGVLIIDSLGHLVLYTQHNWDLFLARAEDKQKIRDDMKPVTVNADNYGRITIPPDMKKIAEIGSKAYLIFASESDSLKILASAEKEKDKIPEFTIAELVSISKTGVISTPCSDGRLGGRVEKKRRGNSLRSTLPPGGVIPLPPPTYSRLMSRHCER